MTSDGPFGAIVLAGGDARRLGGVDKAGLPVGGAPMLLRVLRAVRDAQPRIVVGPSRGYLPADVRLTREAPPGGGPVAALAAGLAVLDRAPDPPATVAVLAADLPLLTSSAITLLRVHLAEYHLGDLAAVDGAVFVDDAGRRQLLCGVWRTAALVRAVAEAGDPADQSMRYVLRGVRVAETLWRSTDRGARPPWFDCDTEADLRLAQEWTE